MIIGARYSGFAFIGDRSGVIARQDIERLRVHAKAHVFGRNVQNSFHIVAEMMQVGFGDLFEKEITLRKPVEPFSSQRSRFFFLALGVENGRQLPRGAEVVWSGSHNGAQVRLRLLQIALAGREFSQT